MRAMLIDRAARMLRSREPVTLRSVVEGTGVSTMAVYTYFGGMDGLWRAMRQEGFTRLAANLARVRTTADPVRDLAALGAAYLANALRHPDLYRVMFDAGFELDNPATADESLYSLVAAVERAKAAERFRADVDAVELATQTWVTGHGLASLMTTGPLPPAALAHGAPMLVALYTRSGDDPDKCHRSVARGWKVD